MKFTPQICECELPSGGGGQINDPLRWIWSGSRPPRSNSTSSSCNGWPAAQRRILLRACSTTSRRGGHLACLSHPLHGPQQQGPAHPGFLSDWLFAEPYHQTWQGSVRAWSTVLPTTSLSKKSAYARGCPPFGGCMDATWGCCSAITTDEPSVVSFAESESTTIPEQWRSKDAGREGRELISFPYWGIGVYWGHDQSIVTARVPLRYIV